MYPNVNSVKLKVQLPVSSVRPAYHCWDSLTSWRRCINWSCSKVGSQWGILSWKLVQSIGPGLLVRVWGSSNNSFLQNEKNLFSIVLPNSYTIVYRYFFSLWVHTCSNGVTNHTNQTNKRATETLWIVAWQHYCDHKVSKQFRKRRSKTNVWIWFWNAAQIWTLIPSWLEQGKH